MAQVICQIFEDERPTDFCAFHAYNKVIELVHIFSPFYLKVLHEARVARAVFEASIEKR